MIECSVCHYKSNAVGEIPLWDFNGDITEYEGTRYCHPCAQQIFGFLSGAVPAVPIQLVPTCVSEPTAVRLDPADESIDEPPVNPFASAHTPEPVVCGICMHTKTTNPWGSCDECDEDIKPIALSLMWQETGHDPGE
jgi:uncharacterized protein YuzB (UPF0349 family)